MVTMANFVTGPFLDLFGLTVYDHLNITNIVQNIIFQPRSQDFLPSHTDWAVKILRPPNLKKKRPGVEDDHFQDTDWVE